MRILLVEDRPKRARTLQAAFRRENLGLEVAPSAGQALKHFERKAYDVILLDPGFRGRDARSLLKKLRRTTSAPILVLNVRSRDRVTVLRLGADDCLTSPFSIQELVARVEALSRRSTQLLEPLTVGDLQLDRVRRRALFHGQSVDLSIKEYELLECLMQRAGEVVTRETILRAWNLSADILSNIVDVYISYLRSKIDARFGTRTIRTVRGHGYMFVEWPEARSEPPPRTRAPLATGRRLPEQQH